MVSNDVRDESRSDAEATYAVLRAGECQGKN